MNVHDWVSTDADVLGGTPVFKGTRVPVRSLFEYLERNYTLEAFLEHFPTVPREAAVRVLEYSSTELLADARK